MIKFLLSLVLCISTFILQAQNIVTYAGNTGREVFYDVTQISDGTFLVAGVSANLSWLPSSVITKQLSITANNGVVINNGLGTNRVGFIMQFSPNFSTIISCVSFPVNGVEDVQRIKFSSLPYAPTGNLFISGKTADTRANEGGYYIAKLNFNFINGIPDQMVWAKRVWAEGETQTNQPWDAGSDGKVVYILGQSHAADWCQVGRLDANGTDGIVSQWRTHWDNTGTEFKGLLSGYAGANPIIRSGIVLKRNGRCDLRSWNPTDFNQWSSDGNGGMKKGKWPMDFLYNSPCNTLSVSTTGPGYNGYKASSSQTYAGLAVVVDKRDNSFAIGMNTKSIINSSGLPDFEPALFKMDSAGTLQWWSRLYHEVKPNGDTVISTPDQYIDGIAIDYTSNQIVVNARCHGNNVSNLWQGQNILASPGITGFQKQWTGTNGNIHISWLGKLQWNDGTFKASTYVGEYADVTTGLGSVHPDPNMDAWPNPNGGWPNVNTTRIARGSVKVATDGSVYVAGVGRRTMTTANAHQKMVKQYASTPNASSWNQFIRAYSPNLDTLRYSSLAVGLFDTLTGANGDNTAVFAVHKTTDGIVAVGAKYPSGAEIPLANIPSWGNAVTADTSALLVYYKANNLINSNDFLFFGNGPLPIGVKLNGYSLTGKNNLVWRVSEDKQIIDFQLLKGNSPTTMKPIGSVKANPNQVLYNFDDLEIENGDFFYKVKINTPNETYFSNTINLFNMKNDKINISPNPASNTININTSIVVDHYVISNLSGQIIHKGFINSSKTIDVSAIPSGQYLLSVYSKTQKFAWVIEKK